MDRPILFIYANIFKGIETMIDQFNSYMQIDSRALKTVFKRGGFSFNEMHLK